MYQLTKKEELKSKIWGYSGTVIFHGLVLLIFWLMVLTPPDPPLNSGGMGFDMAFGEADMGGPSETPVEEPAPADPTPPQETSKQPLATQEIEEAPEVTTPVEKTKKPEIKKPEEKKVTPPIEKPRQADQRSLFKKKTVTAGNESGSGDGEIPGNQGSPDGIVGGDPHGNGIGNGGNGSGTGSGDGIGPGSGSGISYVLAGRSLSKRPTIEDSSKETGKVVVSIVVDKNGRVTKAMPNQKGTTTLSPVLLEKAKQAALETKFSPNPNAPDEQFGTITIVFKFKP